MSMIPQAVLFAAEKHKEQLRKGTDIPYIVHPLGVMEILIRAGASKDAVVAGILHDTLEDTDTTYEELVEKFGKRIADIVRACSESDKSLPWKKRKQATIKALKKCNDIDVLCVAMADKTHNLQSTHRDWIEYDDVWTRFKSGQDAQLWYYGEICKIAKKRCNQTDNMALKTLMLNYWWEYDKFTTQIEEEQDHRIGAMCAGIEREDYEPLYYDCTGTTVWERTMGTQEQKRINDIINHPDNAKLLKQYKKWQTKLSKMDVYTPEYDAGLAEMDKIARHFTERDWDYVLYTSPRYSHLFVKMDREKYLGKKTPLVERYFKLSEKLGIAKLSCELADEIAAKMDEIESQFTESDWDKLIKSSPVFMRPMINEQKKKYLKQH